MDVSTVVTIVCSILASSGLWAAIQALINKKSGKEKILEDIKAQVAELKQDNVESKKNQDAMINAQRDLMKERLLENYKRCLAKGFYTRDEREVYEELFERYESEPFKGNGVIHDLHSLMRELPWDKGNEIRGQGQ